MKRLFFPSLVLALSFGVAAFSQPAAALTPPRLPVGQQAPDFSLADTEGKFIKLSDLKGKTVVLEWTNPDCPFVKRHYEDGTMKSLAEKNPQVVWLAVNSTHYFDAEQNAEWKKDQELNYPVLDDNPGTVGKLFEAKTTPHMLIVDSEGVIRYRGAIDDDRFGSKESSERVNYVSKALEDLAAGKEIAVPSTKPYGCSVKYAD